MTGRQNNSPCCFRRHCYNSKCSSSGSIGYCCNSYYNSNNAFRMFLIISCWSILLAGRCSCYCEALGIKTRLSVNKLTGTGTTTTPSRSGLLLIRNRCPNSKTNHHHYHRAAASNQSRLFLSDIPDDESNGTPSQNSRRPLPLNHESASNNHNSNNDNNSKSAPIQQEKSSVSKKETTTTKNKTTNNNNKTNNPNNFWMQWWQNWTTQQPLQSLAVAFEDKFTLGGDLLAIAVYGWTDHFFGADLAQYLVRHTEISAPTVATTALPAWMETASPITLLTQQQVIRTALADELVAQYSPLLQTMGGAATSLALAWLVAGFVWQSFRFKNTLESSLDRVLVHTALTWFTATVLLLLATVLTNVAVAWGTDPTVLITSTTTMAAQKTTIWPTQGDLTFAIDAWSLLTMWRFVICILLGGGMGRK